MDTDSIEINGKAYSLKKFDSDNHSFSMVVNADIHCLEPLLRKVSVIKVLQESFYVIFTRIENNNNFDNIKVIVDPEWLNATNGMLDYPNWCNTEEKQERFYNAHTSYESIYNDEVYITGLVGNIKYN